MILYIHGGNIMHGDRQLTGVCIIYTSMARD